jgi:hypothetical protein
VRQTTLDETADRGSRDFSFSPHQEKRGSRVVSPGGHMQARWYFIIPGVIVAGFAIWYQDCQREQHRLEALQAERDAAARLIAEAEARVARERAEELARRAAQQIREERANQERERRVAQERRDGWSAELAQLRDETHALAAQRDRLTRAIEDEQLALQRTTAAHATLVAEAEFLRAYLREAQLSVQRVQAAFAQLHEPATAE